MMLTYIADKLEAVVTAFVGEATRLFTASRDPVKIKESTDRIAELLREWDAASKTVTRALRGLLDTVRSGCDHKGATTGYNERDGSWMNPCPTCGESK